MNGTDICVYGYLAVLSVCCAFYGAIVIIYGGVDQLPIRVDVALSQDILNNKTLLRNLTQLDNITSGISIDIWWADVEYAAQQYDWSAYQDLFTSIQQLGLTKPRVRVALNFHACNSFLFGCQTDVELPSWVKTVASNYHIYYMDAYGNTSEEYLTSGVDHINMFPPNRTAVEMYGDFVQSFAETFKDLFDSLIYEVQIGLGPQGQLMYPAFSSTKWRMPGVGQFQCYDPYLTIEYQTYANKTREEFNFLPPADAVNYSQAPDETLFFGKPKINGSTSEYGQFFTSWYASRLLQHGGVILSQASSILRSYSPNVTVAAPIGCIYWQNADPSHAAEITAGYMNYTIIAELLQSYNVRMVFGCFDLNDRVVSKDLVDGHAAPQQLVSEMLQTARSVGLKMEATNSDVSFDASTFGLIAENVKHDPKPLVGFTYKYLSTDLLRNLKDFRHLVDMLNVSTTGKQ